MKGDIYTTGVVIASVLFLLLVLAMLGYFAFPLAGSLDFSACWNDVKSTMGKIAYNLEGFRVTVTGEEQNMAVKQGDCSEKILFINHNDLVKDSANYRVFLDVCEASEKGSYILGYPKLPESMGSWWSSPLETFKEKLQNAAISAQVSPACFSLEKPLSVNVNKKSLDAKKAYCLKFPERKGDAAEYDFTIVEGAC